jgi:hypothetical protein
MNGTGAMGPRNSSPQSSLRKPYLNANTKDGCHGRGQEEGNEEVEAEEEEGELSIERAPRGAHSAWTLRDA